MQSGNQRIDYIDISKGIGIILVCIGHFNIHTEDSDFFNLYLWIYSFHMPFFFFVSGMLFGKMKLDIITFLRRKIVSLLIPYFIFSTYNWLLLDLFHFGIPKFLLNGWGSYPLWFIPVLFLVELFHHFIIRGKPWQSILSIVLLAIIFVWKTHYNEGLPYSVDKVPWFYFCFLTGFLIKPLVSKISRTKDERMKILPIILFTIHILLLFVVIIPYNPNYRLQDDDPFSYIFRYVIGMIGTMSLITLSIQMEHLSLELLKWIGRNTMVILCVHLPYFMILQKINYQDIEMGGVNSILAILFSCLSILVYNKFFSPLLSKFNIR